MNVKILLGIGIILLALGCVSSNTETPSLPTQNNTTTPTVPTTPTESTVPTVPNTVETTPETPAPAFSLNDISSHNTASDCWTTISGKVYDLTDFVNGHPGGPGIIAACGIDGTTLFTTRNGNGPHPAGAEKTIEKYYIGELSN